MSLVSNHLTASIKCSCKKYFLLVKLNNCIMIFFIEFRTWSSTAFSRCALSEYNFSSFIPVKSLNDQSPLQNDSGNYCSILGIPIRPFSSSSGSKFLTFSRQNFCARKIISFYRLKKQPSTENNKQGSNKETIKQLFEQISPFFLVIPLFTLSMYIFNSNN